MEKVSLFILLIFEFYNNEFFKNDNEMFQKYRSDFYCIIDFYYYVTYYFILFYYILYYTIFVYYFIIFYYIILFYIIFVKSSHKISQYTFTIITMYGKISSLVFPRIITKTSHILFTWTIMQIFLNDRDHNPREKIFCYRIENTNVRRALLN